MDIDKTASAVAGILRDAVRVCLDLFRIMVPVLLAVKVLQELGAVPYLAAPLMPLMAPVGLPPEMGLVWAAALLNNIYSGLIVLAALPLAEPLSTSQVTVLCTMILVAHGLPVEVRISQRSGARAVFQLLLRFGGAWILGFALHHLYTGLDILNEPAVMLWSPPAPAAGLLAWGLSQLRNLAMIFLVILGLVTFLRLLDAVGATRLMNRLLAPVLSMMGIGERASAITIVGLTLGVSYGGGLIIREAESGRVGSRDIFFSLSLMGLCHSVFEDTMLMVLAGAHLSGVLWGRLIFSLLVVALLVRFTRRLSEATFSRWFGREVGARSASGS